MSTRIYAALRRSRSSQKWGRAPKWHRHSACAVFAIATGSTICMLEEGGASKSVQAGCLCHSKSNHPGATLAKCRSIIASATTEIASISGLHLLSLIHRAAKRMSSGVNSASFSNRSALGMKYAKDQTRAVKWPTRATITQSRTDLGRHAARA